MNPSAHVRGEYHGTAFRAYNRSVSSRRHNLGSICTHLTDASLAHQARTLRLLAVSCLVRAK
jgi:hypothetical protein